MTIKKKPSNSAFAVGVYTTIGINMHYIRAVRASQLIERKPKDLIVGSFGILDKDDREIRINWKVDGWRKSKLTGDANPAPNNPYCDSLFNSMFKGWN